MTDRFDLLEQLGKGGMGVVWKARDRETGQVVALKLLHHMYAEDPDYVARFEREVEIAQRIDSPNVVKVLGYGTRDGLPYMAMELVEGPSLRDRIRDHGVLTWEDARKTIADVTLGLAAAHAVGVVHRDVKPSNILITPDGTAKLADFGIARAMDLTRLTGSSTMLGTPAYMAPDAEASPRADLYGLGCVLYEMLCGYPPFTGDSQQQVLLKHIREAPDLSKTPEPSRRILAWLLSKDPNRRPASADALLAALGGSSGVPKTPAGVANGGFRWRPVALFGGGGLAVTGAVAAIVVALTASGGGGDGHGSAASEPTSIPTLFAEQGGARVTTVPENSPTVPVATTSVATVSAISGASIPTQVGPTARAVATATLTPIPTLTPTATPKPSATPAASATQVASATPQASNLEIQSVVIVDESPDTIELQVRYVIPQDSQWAEIEIRSDSAGYDYPVADGLWYLEFPPSGLITATLQALGDNYRCPIISPNGLCQTNSIVISIRCGPRPGEWKETIFVLNYPKKWPRVH